MQARKEVSRCVFSDYSHLHRPLSANNPLSIPTPPLVFTSQPNARQQNSNKANNPPTLNLTHFNVTAPPARGS